MNTPDIDYTKPDDEPTTIVITNDLIQHLFSSDSAPGQDVATWCDICDEPHQSCADRDGSRCSDNTPAREVAS